MNRAILVKSCQRFRLRRVACEETWIKDLRAAGIVVMTMEGGHTPTVVTEQRVKLRGGDSYSDNSAKLHEALRMLTFTATDFTYLFICDDDTFIHPRRWLAHEPQAEFECRLHWPQTAQEHKLNYGQPWANGGAGWWMSRRLCELYVEKVTARSSYDDVLATRSAQENGAQIIDRPDLYGDDRYCEPAGMVARDNHLITCHPVQPAEMVRLWEACCK